MSVEENKALVHRFVERWNRGKVELMAALDEGSATDIVYHSPSGEDIRGVKGMKQFFSNLFNAFPDLRLTIDDIIAEGDKIAYRWRMTGTHKGEWRGIPPTNKTVMGWGLIIDRVVGGKVVEVWERMDRLGWMQQLGAIPTPKKE